MSLGREPRETPKGRSEGAPRVGRTAALKSCLTEAGLPSDGAPPRQARLARSIRLSGHIGARGRWVNTVRSSRNDASAIPAKELSIFDIID